MRTMSSEPLHTNLFGNSSDSGSRFASVLSACSGCHGSLSAWRRVSRAPVSNLHEGTRGAGTISYNQLRWLTLGSETGRMLKGSLKHRFTQHRTAWLLRAGDPSRGRIRCAANAHHVGSLDVEELLLVVH